MAQPLPPAHHNYHHPLPSLDNTLYKPPRRNSHTSTHQPAPHALPNYPDIVPSRHRYRAAWERCAAMIGRRLGLRGLPHLISSSLSPQRKYTEEFWEESVPISPPQVYQARIFCSVAQWNLAMLSCVLMLVRLCCDAWVGDRFYIFHQISFHFVYLQLNGQPYLELKRRFRIQVRVNF